MRPRRVIGDLNIVGPVIMARRKGLRLSQKELLARLQSHGLDINGTTLSEIERQVRAVRDYELEPIAQALEWGVRELLGVEE